MKSPQKSSIAKDVFAYLLTFVVLFIGVINFMILLWQIIDTQFPDPLSFSYGGTYDMMRNAIASLLVVWPVFLLMSRHLVKDIDTHPEKADIWVKKWLTYLTIFVAAITMIIDLITLINSFLSGELTLRFGLKVAVVLVVSALVFGYEFWELKREPKEGAKQLRLMAGGSIALIILGVIGGFWFVGSPKTARQLRLDDQRVSDLQNIQYQLVSHWNQTDKLPTNLSELTDPITGFNLPVDPETRAGYGYEKVADLKFKLCATFSKDMPSWSELQSKPMPAYDLSMRFQNDSWTHSAGTVCFERTIDPARDKYPKP